MIRNEANWCAFQQKLIFVANQQKGGTRPGENCREVDRVPHRIYHRRPSLHNLQTRRFRIFPAAETQTKPRIPVSNTITNSRDEECRH